MNHWQAGRGPSLADSRANLKPGLHLATRLSQPPLQVAARHSVAKSKHPKVRGPPQGGPSNSSRCYYARLLATRMEIRPPLCAPIHRRHVHSCHYFATYKFYAMADDNQCKPPYAMADHMPWQLTINASQLAIDARIQQKQIIIRQK
jgi:hypothetical protein